MRAFSSSRISVSIAVAIAAFILGSLVLPGKATAREPDYKVFVAPESGGSGGGSEWKTDPVSDGQVLPVESGRAPGAAQKYTKGSQADVEASWATRVESWYNGLLKAVSAVVVRRYL